MRRLFIAAAVLAAVLPLSAQTLYSLDAAGVVTEQNGPPLGIVGCAFPTGPLVSTFPTAVAFVCPTPGAIVAPAGGIAVDRAADTIWVTDGVIVAEYTAAGVPINGFIQPAGAALPGVITGMAFDPAGILWITDGVFVNGIVPPPAPGCAAAGLVFAAPFIPLLPPAGLMTDLTWDPSTASLLACDAAGGISSFVPGGPPGPYAPLFAGVPGPCVLGVPLTGIAFNPTTPDFFGGPPAIYLTDGAGIAYVVPVPGTPGAPIVGLFTTVNCFAPVGAASIGLACSSRPNPYGVGTDSAGLFAPVAGTIGQATTPNPAFALTIAGGDPTPGTLAGLFYNFGFACPPYMGLKGNTIYIAAPPIDSTLIVPLVGGAAIVPIPLPPGLPVGAPGYMQWFIKKGSGKFQVTNALEFIIGLP